MTEIDTTKNKVQTTPQTRRSVLAKFVANFSGGVSPNTMQDSGRTALAQVSAGMDSTVVHKALENGGHSKSRLQGSFLEMVPFEGGPENILQQLPDKVIHITEGEYTDLLEEAPKPAVIGSDPSIVVREKPAKVIYLNVFSTNEEPDKDIEHWFNSEKKLDRAA
jgi:hypothetical protein